MARIVLDLDIRLLFLSRTLLISLPNAGAPTITPKSKAALTAGDVDHCGSDGSRCSWREAAHQCVASIPTPDSAGQYRSRTVAPYAMTGGCALGAITGLTVQLLCNRETLNRMPACFRP